MFTYVSSGVQSHPRPIPCPGMASVSRVFTEVQPRRMPALPGHGIDYEGSLLDIRKTVVSGEAVNSTKVPALLRKRYTAKGYHSKSPWGSGDQSSSSRLLGPIPPRRILTCLGSHASWPPYAAPDPDSVCTRTPPSAAPS